MVVPVSEAGSEMSGKEKKRGRRWDGYVCPACRVVFRMPSDHDGKGVVCPSCRRLLRMPQEEDDVAPLVPRASGGAGAAMEDGRAEMMRHRHRETTPDWERGDAPGEARGAWFQGVWLWAGFAGVIALLVLGGVMRFLSGGGTSGALTDETVAVLSGVGEIGAEPGEESENGKTDADEVAASVAGDPAEVLRDAESVARKFVAARSVEELLPLVRNPAGEEPKIREWYRKHGFGDLELTEFGVNRMVVFHNGLASVTVKTNDYKIRKIVVEKTSGGFRVDWESWVGWSEMSWRRLRETRPVVPKLFRVTAAQGKYYNFGFSDDTKWRCYQLGAKEGVDFIFGYVKRGSPLDMKMAGVGDKPVALTLMIRYPENAPADNQVIIDSLVVKGWVIGADHR